MSLRFKILGVTDVWIVAEIYDKTINFSTTLRLFCVDTLTLFVSTRCALSLIIYA